MARALRWLPGDWTPARLWVPGSVFVAICVAGYFRGSLAAYLGHVLALAIAFLLPAQWIGRPGDVPARWRIVLPCILGGTLVWDFLMQFLVPRHHFLQGWWLVYSSSLLSFGLLLQGCGLIVKLAERARHGLRGRQVGRTGGDDRNG